MEFWSPKWKQQVSLLQAKGSTETACNRIITMVKNGKLEKISVPYWPVQCVFSWMRKNKMWSFTATWVPKTPTMWPQPVNLSLCWMSNWFESKCEDIMLGKDVRYLSDAKKQSIKLDLTLLVCSLLDRVDSRHKSGRIWPVHYSLKTALCRNQNIRKT